MLGVLREPLFPTNVTTTNSITHIEEHAVAAVWLGHGSVLARLGHTNLLVDPVFSERVGLRLGPTTFGPKRLRSAPIAATGLPHIHLVLITHAHFDHLDRPTLRQLARPETTAIIPPKTRRLVPRGFGHVVELRHSGALRFNGVRLEALRPAHGGARRVVDRHRQPNSYLVETAAGRILFAGDTAYTDVFRNRGPVDLAVFGVGAYDPREHMHATPEQVWHMFRHVQGRWLLPIHHSTFELSDEPLDEPMRRLLAAAGPRSSQVIQVEPGELWVRPAAPARPR